MANTILAGDGDGIVAVFAGDADFAVYAGSSSSAVRAGDRNARLTVCAIFAGDEEAVFAIFARLAIMADDNGSAALGFDSDLAILAVFTGSPFWPIAS